MALARPQLVRGMRPRIRGQQPVQPLSLEQIIEGGSPGIQVNDPRIASLLQGKQSQIDQLVIQNGSLQERCTHLTGLLIGILQHFHEGKPVRIPLKLLEAIPGELGVNDNHDTVSQEIVISLMTQQEWALANQGLVQIEADIVVPKRSPFTVKLKLKDGDTFMGVLGVKYKGGKSDGIALDLVINAKPKKPRDVAIEKDGLLRFTTDSAGLQVHVKFVARLKPEEKDPEPDTSPITCEGEFHRRKDAPGLRCDQCGDSRKLLALQ